VADSAPGLRHQKRFASGNIGNFAGEFEPAAIGSGDAGPFDGSIRELLINSFHFFDQIEWVSG
jgi:hypothetical protein